MKFKTTIGSLIFSHETPEELRELVQSTLGELETEYQGEEEKLKQIKREFATKNRTIRKDISVLKDALNKLGGPVQTEQPAEQPNEVQQPQPQ